MADINKKDQAALYSRAHALQASANEIDTWADQLMVEGLVDRSNGHRQVATAMRAEAVECRRWADAWRPT